MDANLHQRTSIAAGKPPGRFAPGAVRYGYRVERWLGRGGVGEVWLGRNCRSGTLAALKVLRSHPPRHQGVFRRLLDLEGDVIKRLRHPHIVQLYEAWDDCLVMDYVEGLDLARRLGTALPPREALDIAEQIGSALAYAHARGVAHRDVTPSNILLDANTSALLTDFGLAVDLSTEGREEAVGGFTPAYAAPEQQQGRGNGALADQYGLARTLMRMLVGEALPEENEEALARLPEGLPNRLAAILRQATSSQPSLRFPSVAAFVAELNELRTRRLVAKGRQLAPVRDGMPFRWSRGHCGSEAVTPRIREARYLVGELVKERLVRPDLLAEMKSVAGYREFGFSAIADETRLGLVAQRSAWQRARAIVVMMHGWGTTRKAWPMIAARICRDNADVVVLTPDLFGFGESFFEDSKLPLQTLGLRAQWQACKLWLDSLGFERIPKVLVGHSCSAMMLMSVSDEELTTSDWRVAVTPAFPTFSIRTRLMCRLAAMVTRSCMVTPSLLRGLGWLLLARANVHKSTREHIFETVLAADPRKAGRLFLAMKDTELAAPGQLERCHVIMGANDPLVPSGPSIQKALEQRWRMPAEQIWQFGSGGHLPHLESRTDPGGVARNVAQVVFVINEALAETRRDGEREETMLV